MTKTCGGRPCGGCQVPPVRHFAFSGLPVDEYAVTDASGVATFENVLIGTGYTLEEIDTAERYVVPDSQTAAVEWNTVTNKSFSNILKKWNVTVTKSDRETGTAQGDASLTGAAYGIFKGEQLVDTYYTDENGQFTTSYYVCGDDWTIRELSPSEGYLLDGTVYSVGAEAEHYTIELKQRSCRGCDRAGQQGQHRHPQAHRQRRNSNRNSRKAAQSLPCISSPLAAMRRRRTPNGTISSAMKTALPRPRTCLTACTPSIRSPAGRAVS